MNYQWKIGAPKKENTKICCGQNLSVVFMMKNYDVSDINKVSVWVSVLPINEPELRPSSHGSKGNKKIELWEMIIWLCKF